MGHYLTAVLLGAALMATAANAQEHDRDRRENGQAQRYYDKTGRDWHDWNDARIPRIRLGHSVWGSQSLYSGLRLAEITFE